MNEHIDFVVFCIEEYKSRTNLSGKEVVTIFSNKNVFDFIVNNYNALHTTGSEYIVNDIRIFASKN